MAQGFFVGGTGRRAVAHTRPAFPKNAYGPVGIPLVIGRLRCQAMNPTLPKEVKAWGEGLLRPKEISRYRDTLGQIHAADNTAGRSATRHLERCQIEIDLPLWQRNLSVQITVRRVHYGEMVKAPTTETKKFSLLGKESGTWLQKRVLQTGKTVFIKYGVLLFIDEGNSSVYLQLSFTLMEKTLPLL